MINTRTRRQPWSFQCGLSQPWQHLAECAVAAQAGFRNVEAALEHRGTKPRWYWVHLETLGTSGALQSGDTCSFLALWSAMWFFLTRLDLARKDCDCGQTQSSHQHASQCIFLLSPCLDAPAAGITCSVIIESLSSHRGDRATQVVRDARNYAGIDPQRRKSTQQPATITSTLN